MIVQEYAVLLRRKDVLAGSLFEKYGGFASVSRVVLSFYDRVLDSERLSPYFSGVDMRRQVEHQTAFMSSVMGGPASHSNEVLRQVHAHLKVTEADFDELVELLRETFEDFDFAPEDIESIIADIRARQPFIVSGGKGD
jgi:hemoglobin